ncbi:O-antigen ligase family protein [Amycolatopsis panacis]|uniref:O-antigen ligase domain-containing protein n=1 Tax=Amycolatopsis panacis TaxID=2340917 RepID=A0A419I4Q3_9PSEU|nr:O-antigen ligase family protein [Amycolatopsis panacis]RJQ85473.1 O-antigen ligase domain-containing protein [Amycolatopsis panacis]
MTSTAVTAPPVTEFVAPARPWRGTAERAAALAACTAMAFQPILRPAGPGNSAPVDLFTAATVLLVAVWAATSGRKLGAPYALPLGVLIVAGAIAGLAGPLPGTSLLELSQDLVLLAWGVALYNIARRPGVLRMLTTTFAWASIGWATLVVVGWLANITAIEGLSPTEGDRVLFTLGDPNYASAYWVVSLLVVFAAKRPRHWALRWFGYAMLIWAIALTESNGGVLELLVGLGFLGVVACYRRRGIVGVLAFAMLVASVVGVGTQVLPFSRLQTWALQSGQSYLVNSLGRSQGSSSQRALLIQESLQLYQSDGLLGSGPRTTKQLLIDRNYPYAKEAHDDYLAALTERGVLGVAGMAMLVLAAGWRAGRALRAPPGQGFAAEVPRPAGIVAALLVMALAGTYYQVLHFRFVWIVLVFVAVLASRPDAGYAESRRMPS